MVVIYAEHVHCRAVASLIVGHIKIDPENMNTFLG